MSYIALCGSNESVLELFLFLPRKYKVLLSSLCPTVRLISKLMVSVANIFAGLLHFFICNIDNSSEAKKKRNKHRLNSS